MRRTVGRTLTILVLSAGCGSDAPEPPAAPVFRDIAQPIGSTTRGDPADMAGDWVVEAAYRGAPAGIAGIAAGDRLTLAFAPGGSGTLAVDGSAGREVVPVTVTGEGRWRIDVPGGDTLWLIWVDDDFRTAVVGGPGGGFGWIMNRPGAVSADRTVAAREILVFSGYDLDRLGD